MQQVNKYELCNKTFKSQLLLRYHIKNKFVM